MDEENTCNSLQTKSISKSDQLQKPPKEAGKWASSRYCLSYLIFCGIATIYAQRVALSVAILSMVNSTNRIQESNNLLNSSCSQTYIYTTTQESNNGEFNWSRTQEGIVLGSFYYGYMASQIPGGYLAGRYGMKIVFGVGNLVSAAMTFITPVAARTSFNLFVVVRIIQGLAQGVYWPALNTLWGRWAPPVERSLLMTLSSAGLCFGVVFSQPVSGVICSSDHFGGWPTVFYLFGALGIIWGLFWHKLAYSSPEENPGISKEELDFIKLTVPPVITQDRNPWKQILKSGPVWALTAAYFANAWGFEMLFTFLPNFLKDILGFDISQSGFIATLPYLVMLIFTNVFSYIADYLRANRYLTTSQTRKIFNGTGQIGAGVFMIITGYINCNQSLAVFMLCLVLGVNTMAHSGYLVNAVDLSSKYCGIVMGFANTIANISGFVAPTMVGVMTHKHNTQEQWQIIFYISAAIYTLGSTIFILFGSGNEQEWNKTKVDIKIERSNPAYIAE